MTYKVLAVNKKITKTGKPYAIVTLEDNGREVQASMWEGHESVSSGQQIEGEIFQKGDFTNFRLAGVSRPSSGNRTAQIRESQEFKAASIQRAQDVSQLGMKIAAAMRDSTQITLAELKDQPFPTPEEFKERWMYWRDYLINQFDQEKEMRDR